MQISFDSLSVQYRQSEVNDEPVVNLVFLKDGKSVAEVKHLKIQQLQTITFSGLTGTIPIQIGGFTGQDLADMKTAATWVSTA